MKKRTRTLVIIGAILGVPLVALAVVPMLFGDRIAARVKAEVNDAIEARVDWRDASLGVFRNFPNVTLHLDQLSVAGTKRFTGDTLAKVGRSQVVLDLASVLRNIRSGDPVVVRAVAAGPAGGRAQGARGWYRQLGHREGHSLA